jgi:Tetracyclin repressor-like, C-terminal domain
MLARQLHLLLRRMYQVLVAHPGIAAMALVDPPTTEAILRLTENLLGILLAGGFDAQDAAWTCDIFVLLVTAAAREDDVRRPRGGSDDDSHRKQVDRIYKPSRPYRPTGSP